MATKLTPEQVDALLDKLSEDDAFREAFQENPAAALRDLGVKVDDADVPPVKALADKETIRSSRGRLRADMLGPLGFWPHKVE